MPTTSTYPPVDIPNVGLFQFLFERKDREFPDDKVLYVDPNSNRSYTFAQVRSTAIDFGKGLKGLWDWQKGDVLALYTPNCIDTPPIIWGTHWAGGIVSPANPGYTEEELAYQLKDSGARALLTQLPFIDVALKACQKVGIPEDRIALIGDARHPEGRYKHFTSVRNISGTQRFRRAKVDPDKDLAFLVYSSGTTGLPKGVMLSHTNIVANVLQLTAGESQLSWKPSKASPDGDAILAFLPFFHIYGLTCLIHQTAFRGLKCVVLPKFEIEAWCKIVQDHKISMSYVVPPVVLLLTKHPIIDKYDLSSLRMMNSGAAPLTRELVEATYKRIKVPLKQGYGLSETSPTTHTQPWDLWRSTVGSVGILLPNMTAKYMSPEEKELPQGEVGELWLKGPNIFKGYLNNVEGTKNALTEDGYFKTGDVGYQDKDGNFYITDRIKELIKVSGFQVAPAELEGKLIDHPLIDDVAIIGVTDTEKHTELPRAYIVHAKKKGDAGDAVTGMPTKDTEKDAEEIKKWLAGKVIHYKQLKGGVRFIDAIPKSATGKILRRMLKERVKKEEAGSKPKL